MDYEKILRKAEIKLGAEFPEVVKDIKKYIAMGSTGGEIIGMVGKYIKDLEFNNIHAYNILKEDIEEYLLECKRQGHVFRKL